MQVEQQMHLTCKRKMKQSCMTLIQACKCNKYKNVTKYISVFAPGTLGIYQTIIWSQLTIGLLGDIVLMYQYSIYVFNIWISNYQNNLQYMGLSNTSIINLQHMELWVIGGLLL